ncbi:MAG: hypothetical protein KGI37_06115 [Alphaproteobacteria bacterium]|nr:hypothetical protein [Alphaproteobacteria bacterium]
MTGNNNIKTSGVIAMSKSTLPRIAFCTTCKGRAHHLAKTLPQNMRNNADYPNAVFVVLDYNSTDGLGDHMRRTFAAPMASGRLAYYHNPEPQQFHMAHAKNMAARAGIREGADVLVNLDADNLTGAGFASYVAEEFIRAHESEDAIFLRAGENHEGPGGGVSTKMPQGCGGRIAITAHAFMLTGGYDEDEAFRRWSPDDKDFALRLTNLGFVRHGMPDRFKKAIGHSQDSRLAGYDMLDRQNMGEIFHSIMEGRQNMTVANNGRMGMGVVYKNFDPDPIMFDALPTRIFGVGMHKTATTSLAAALGILGYDTAHWESPRWAFRIHREMTAQGRSPMLERHYALCDLPMPLHFKALDNAYPGSKFILTTRDEEPWLQSVRNHWQRYRKKWDRDGYSHKIHEALYGRTDFDEDVFRARYRAHNEAVMKHFMGRPGDLVVMNMDREAGWPELCRLLGRAMPGQPYPRKFVTPQPEPQPKPQWKPAAAVTVQRSVPPRPANTNLPAPKEKNVRPG